MKIRWTGLCGGDRIETAGEVVIFGASLSASEREYELRVNPELRPVSRLQRQKEVDGRVANGDPSLDIQAVLPSQEARETKV
jgi:hypothetical protein